MTRSNDWWFVAPLDEDRRGNVGMAMPQDEDRSADLRHRHRMLDGEPVEDWTTARYVLDRGGFGDYPRELRGYRLCSEQLRAVLDEHAGADDRLQWLDATVKSADGEERPYWVLNILRPAAATAVAGLEEFDWQILRERAADGSLAPYRVLPGPGFGLPDFVVADEVRAAILESGCDVAFRHL